ncbi:hypothetical protein MTR67_007780 [Solanum verrucosum]|uniref:peroxidase n=1 Tax=Solanum verrucosum TaxID=315347 RepID=A0AAF0TIJ6_SOLVR|nr:hypothetical protein MTR67_007780 [Solanum verrucosum]
MTSKALFFGVLLFSALSAFAEEKEDDNPGLVMDYYKRTCPQAEDIIKEQVNLLYNNNRTMHFLGYGMSSMTALLRDGIVALGGPYIPLKTGRRDGRSRADILGQHLPSHNESISVVLERFANIGINTPGAVALLGSQCVLPTVY